MVANINHEQMNQEEQNNPLFSSFENDEPSTTREDNESGLDITDKNESDDRLFLGTEEACGAEVGASSDQLQEQVENTTNTTISPYPEINELGNLQDSRFSLNSIRNNFNFLDRMFKTNPYQKITSQGPNDNDGVFNNLSAKPDTQPQVDSDKPPTYDEAAADATPPYWEASVLAQGFTDEIFVDGLPVGNIINFLWNLMVSTSFQFVGFLLTYILHTSHAAKQGSRAGLGLTFISYGYYMIPFNPNGSGVFHKEHATNNKIEPEDPNTFEKVSSDYEVTGSLDMFHSTLSSGTENSNEHQSTSTDMNNGNGSFIAYLVISFGIFIFIKAIVNYHRAKKMERVITQPPTNLPVVEEV